MGEEGFVMKKMIANMVECRLVEFRSNDLRYYTTSLELGYVAARPLFLKKYQRAVSLTRRYHSITELWTRSRVVVQSNSDNSITSGSYYKRNRHSITSGPRPRYSRVHSKSAKINVIHLGRGDPTDTYYPQTHLVLPHPRNLIQTYEIDANRNANI